MDITIDTSDMLQIEKIKYLSINWSEWANETNRSRVIKLWRSDVVFLIDNIVGEREDELVQEGDTCMT